MHDTVQGAGTALAPARPGGPHDRPHPRYRLVATDLDGTLLRGDATVSSRTRAALRRIRGAGAEHVIVTGRPARGCLPLFAALGYRGLAVCGQGAQVYDAGRRALLSATVLDSAAARAALRRLTARVGPLDLAVVTSGEDAEFVVSDGFCRGDERELAPYRTVGAAGLWDRPVDKVLLRHRTLDDGALTEAALLCAGPDLNVVHAGPGIVELLPAGFDKSTGLARVARSLGLTAEDVIAFGDMPNDIPLLRWSGHAVAMANAHPDLKAVADEIAPANDDDGVAEVLERILDQGARH